MNNLCRRNAFTLIEVLIVVIIMAVLAATIIPQFSSSTRDAKDSTLKFNMHTLRSQIEMYKVHHLGAYPAADKLVDALTKRTNASGATGDDPVSFPFGPYIDQALPVNPLDGKNTVVATTAAPPADKADGSGGWQYNASTGGIWPNSPKGTGATEFDYTTLPK